MASHANGASAILTPRLAAGIGWGGLLLTPTRSRRVIYDPCALGAGITLYGLLYGTKELFSIDDGYKKPA
ncbi:MAG: hypothetical protein AAGM22_18380 [Acidobacteriota bacterium]